ncbi:protein PHYTOCHROME KINASE SUBSTRATE 4 [Elaeis guineensis]|uniref:Protein PHYTOCHROME KINASE SUBSTRATE 4 n=1 Tax=Elaeis guineensis var. tenera TaxID=51953 RepID=A0A6I9QXR2_ELAGV|nr:protein PHYTOCHROME KINASE SUBSTRATE 4 [Elaeis guineensis]
MAAVSMASPRFNPNLTNKPFTITSSSSNPRDDSFSSHYTLIRENFPPELGSSAPSGLSFQISLGARRPSDGEIDIFDAKNYFSGRMDGDTELQPENIPKTPTNKEEKSSVKTKSRTRSIASEMSGNSQITLLREHRKYPLPGGQRPANTKSFLHVFRCSCSRKNAVEVDQDAGSSTTPSSRRRTARGREGGDRRPASRRWEEHLGRDLRTERFGFGLREEAIGFPPNLNFGMGKVTVVRDLKEEGRVGGVPKRFVPPFFEKNDHIGSSLRRSLTMTPVLNPAGSGGGGRDDDLGSESSSELFEIESISLNSHPFFPATGYEPSEASIEWSVVTASAANCSVASECNDDGLRGGGKTPRQHRSGLLLGCVSEKAVNVKADAYNYKVPERVSLPAARYHGESCRAMDLGPARAGRALSPGGVSRVRASRALYMH